MLLKDVLGNEYNEFHEQHIYKSDVNLSEADIIYTNNESFFASENIAPNKYKNITMAKIFNKYTKKNTLKIFSNLKYLELYVEETNYNLFYEIKELENLEILYVSVCNTYYDNPIDCELLSYLPNIKTLIIELFTCCEIGKYLNNLPVSLENIVFITSDVGSQENYVKYIIKNIKLPFGCNLWRFHYFSMLSDKGLRSYESDMTEH